MPSEKVWAMHRVAVTQRDAKRTPGYRSRRWWEFEGTKFGPRLRLGGRGQTANEGTVCGPHLEHGIPTDWAWIDESDPPAYESEAQFLARHHLFLKGERRCVKRRDFEPEVIIGSWTAHRGWSPLWYYREPRAFGVPAHEEAWSSSQV
jgi:hypothetical protein